MCQEETGVKADLRERAKQQKTVLESVRAEENERGRWRKHKREKRRDAETLLEG